MTYELIDYLMQNLFNLLAFAFGVKTAFFIVDF